MQPIRGASDHDATPSASGKPRLCLVVGGGPVGVSQVFGEAP